MTNALKKQCAASSPVSYTSRDEISGEAITTISIDDSLFDESICASITERYSSSSITANDHSNIGKLYVMNRAYGMLSRPRTPPQPPNSLYENVPNITGLDILKFAKQISNGMVGTL